MEFGSIGLRSSDPLVQPTQGLVGALVVEPKNATVTEDPNTHATATVAYTKPDGTKAAFREFVSLPICIIMGYRLLSIPKQATVYAYVSVLAGVIVAGARTSEIFIENGRFHGRQIAADLARKLSPTNREPVGKQS